MEGAARDPVSGIGVAGVCFGSLLSLCEVWAMVAATSGPKGRREGWHLFSFQRSLSLFLLGGAAGGNSACFGPQVANIHEQWVDPNAIKALFACNRC